jgi:probable F420-dependent oxidoreductase
MTLRKFRFGVVAAQARSADEWAEKARRVEGLGFATLVVPDGLQHTLSPFPALTAAAAATRSLRVGTYVISNDYRHPVLLAKEAATLDLLSGGRLELGVGAGRPSAEADNRAMGLAFDPGHVRVARLAEALRIIKPLLGGESVDLAGTHYTVANAAISPPALQRPTPILVAGSRRQLLTLAAREADIVALGVPPDATEAQVAERVGWIREAAEGRFAQLELNLNLVAVGGRLPRYLTMTLGSAAARLAESDAVPVLKGTPAEMRERLLALRERHSISYVMVSDELVDALAPVLSGLAGL